MADTMYRVPPFKANPDGPNNISREQRRVIEFSSEIMTALEDAGSALLKSEPERRAALKRIKDLYFEITNWYFVALPPLPEPITIASQELQEYIAQEGDTDGLA